MANPARKFVYVEQAYFQRWWSEQTEAKKQDVRGLVANGQLEFINGGWVSRGERNDGGKGKQAASAKRSRTAHALLLGVRLFR
jgi:hypothetical protein